MSRLWKMDMHMHSHRSFDSLNQPRRLVEAARRLGLDRIIITDHNEIEGAREARRIDPELVIVGEEVKTAQGIDVIGIFIEELIPKGTDAVETCRLIREQGGVVYLPHPFDSSRAGGPETIRRLADHVDVVEVHNARCFPVTLNDRAAQWAAETGLLCGAGSDAHTIPELGRGYVELPPFQNTRQSLLEALASARVAGTVNTSPVYRLGSLWARVRKALPF